MSASEGAGGVLTPGKGAIVVPGLHNHNSAPPQQQQQVPVHQPGRLPYNVEAQAVYSPAPAPGSSQAYQTSGGAGAGAGAIIEGAPASGNVNPLPKKRGRPRKYGQNANLPMAPGGGGMLSPPPNGGAFSPQPAGPMQVVIPSSSQAAAPTTTSDGLASPPPAKKSRGRPPGSGTGKKQNHPHKAQSQTEQQQLEAFGSVGYGFTPHIFNVNPGEDLSAKIMSFSQHGPKDICVLSASGCISNVTIRQSATSGGTATYEGRFEIVSLSGSFLLTEIGSHRTRTGGLSITLSGPDGRVFGGCVAGLLIAASPVQVIVASFITDTRKSVKNTDALSGPVRANNAGVSSPPSHGTPSCGSSGGPVSPPNLSSGSYPMNGQGMASMPWK